MRSKPSTDTFDGALHQAICAEDLPGLLRLIGDCGRPLPPSTHPSTAPRLALCLDRFWMEGFDALLAAGCDANVANRNGLPLLSFLINYDELDRARRTIAAGADLHALNRAGGDAMHHASNASDSMPEAAQMLLEANGGGWPVRFDDNGMSQVMIAAQRDNAAVLDLLLKAGHPPDHVGTKGRTPAMAAIRAGSASCLLTLLKAGASPEGPMLPNGEPTEPPLRFAAKCGELECVRVLLDAGADPQRPSPSGRTPAEEALASPSPNSAEIHHLISRQIALAEASELGVHARRAKTERPAKPSL